MIVQISSGQGPCECELAVLKLYDKICNTVENVKLLEANRSRFCSGFTSVIFSTDTDLSDLAGTVEWICTSPLRPKHKRKNWFIDVSIIPEADKVNTQSKVKVEYFHCGGNGGQNVNKVETGVRLIHEATSTVVTSTSERTQALNRKIAEDKLTIALSKLKENALQKQKANAWSRHKKIIRGNPVKVYEGINFKLKK